MILSALFIALVSNVAVGLQNSGYSHLELSANPGIFHPVLTKKLQLRCSVKNNKLQAQRTTSILQSQGEVEFSTLLSLVMTKTNKETGLNETIASVTGCDSPVIESMYDGTVQVEGNTEGSPREGEQGFITLTWNSPLEEHAGEFYCEASALNSEKHSETLIASIEIQAIEPKISDIVNYISTNDKDIFDLKSKVLELYEENQYLKNKANELAKEDIDIKYKMDQIPIPIIQTGSLFCEDQTINFNPAFKNAPKIFTSFTTGHSYSYTISVSSVDTTNCSVTCDGSSSARFNWIAIGF